MPGYLTEEDLARMQAGGGAARIVLEDSPRQPAPGGPLATENAPPRRLQRGEPPSPAMPPKPGRPRVELIDQRVAKIIAERAAAMAWRHGHPAGGISWSSRADDCRLKKLPGMLGAVALWSYEVTGRAHFGWFVAGVTVPWVAQIEAATGHVLGVQFPGRKR